MFVSVEHMYYFKLSSLTGSVVYWHLLQLVLNENCEIYKIRITQWTVWATEG